jgi:TPR repeat protein
MQMHLSSLIVIVFIFAAPQQQSMPNGAQTEKSAESEPFAVDPIKAKCESSDMEACLFLGLAYQKGIGVSKDQDKAEKLFEKACNGKSEAACVALALLRNDPSLLEQSCNRKFGEACFELSLVKDDSDPTESQKLAQRACDLSYGPGCTRVGQLLQSTDPDGAQKRYEQGCVLGDGGACYLLGMFLSKAGDNDSSVAAKEKLQESL